MMNIIHYECSFTLPLSQDPKFINKLYYTADFAFELAETTVVILF